MAIPLQKLDYFRNLFALLDDESSTIREILQERTREDARTILLDKYTILGELDDRSASKFEEYLDLNHLDLVTRAMEQLHYAARDEINLEEGILLLAYWRFPELNCRNVQYTLDELAREIELDMPKSGHPLGFIDHLSNVLFKTYHFRGNSHDYYNPNNSYLNKVLETGLGIPISLSTLYMLIAKRLGFPIFGVCMPSHFILKFANSEDEIFFDPFYGGKIYSRQACIDYLSGFDLNDPDSVLEGCTHAGILKRMIRNLRLAYSSHTPAPQRVNELEQLLSIWQN